MPFDEYKWVERSEVLTFDEIERLARLFAGLGASQIRLTGGEPLVRRGLPTLIEKLKGISGIKDLSLTTNGSLLGELAAPLRSAGLDRINVSLDTLREDRFRTITQRAELKPVLEGLMAAKALGMNPIKINAVVIRGFNDDELLDLVEFGRKNGFEVRFIEYMDVGNASGWTPERTFSKREMFEVIHARYPLREIGRGGGSAPAVDYEFVDGSGAVGIIGSVTEPFCSSCTRARLTADGKFVTCLFAESGFDLKSRMRAGATDEELKSMVAAVWSGRADRYSDLRWAQLQSGKPYEVHSKIEMITLGG
jgi:cyclic pyranopterin phosphate synthase